MNATSPLQKKHKEQITSQQQGVEAAGNVESSGVQQAVNVQVSN